jgi:hypothetical protein
MSTCLKGAWPFGAFTWFGGTILLVSFVGDGTAAPPAGLAGLAAAAACLRPWGVKFLASVPASRSLWTILSVTEECGISLGTLFVKLYLAVF